MHKNFVYCKIDSSPLPPKVESGIVFDLNLENYFCTLFGKKLLEEVNINQPVPFSGKIISDFKDSFPDIYNEIIVQWESMLVKLLGSDHGENLHFEMNLPATYINWLSHHDNSIFREIGNKQFLHLSFKGEDLYKELVASVLMKRLRFTLSKITDEIDFIAISFQSLDEVTPFINYLKQLNNSFRGLEVISRQKFLDTYVAEKMVAEKKATLESMYELYPLRDERIRIRDKKTKKYGFINEQMEIVIPCEYDFCANFVDGFAFVYDKYRAFQIDKTGSPHGIPSYDYRDVYDFSNGLARVRKDYCGNYAYINKEGREMINIHCDGGCNDFKEGLAMVRINGKSGFIDKTGTIVIPCQFDWASSFEDGLACVAINDRYGFVNKKGIVVIPCRFIGASSFSEGLARIREATTGRVGFIDKTGTAVIPHQYFNGGSFSEGLAEIQLDINCHSKFIDKTGKIVFSTLGESCKSFKDGLAAIKKDDKVGFIDKTGKVVIPCRFETWRFDHCNYYSFTNGLAVVFNKDPVYGYRGQLINKKGEVVFSSSFINSVGVDGLANVDSGGFIDIKGNEIIPRGIFFPCNSNTFSEGMLWIPIYVRGGEKQWVLFKKDWLI
ncbi:MAG: WG repeat-containing protein [Bacteroidaceae bacterium]|nr:WG repeat-containing protein [Bacteroidaceae bacterium]